MTALRPRTRRLDGGREHIGSNNIAVKGKSLRAFTAMNALQFFAATATVVAGGCLTMPVAHASSCTVNGEYLSIHQVNGNHTVTLQASGSTLGPGVVVATDGINPVYGHATGSIAGTTVNFVIDWDDNQGTAIYSGDTGSDGFAHGNSTGNVVPINLWNPGPWDSTDALDCSQLTPTGQTAFVNQPDNIYDQPDGNGNEYLDDNGNPIFKPVGQVQLVEPDGCRNDWCHVVAPEVPGPAWIYAGDGFVTVQ